MVRCQWLGADCQLPSWRTLGHGGYVSSVGLAAPEHGVVVALVFNGMTDQARHDARMAVTLDALYVDLGIGLPGDETAPRAFGSLDASLRSQPPKS